jgi:chitin deacetylase
MESNSYLMRNTIVYITTGFFTLLIAGIATFQYSRSWKHAFFISPIYTLSTVEKIVALTFDDGPSERRTPMLLDLLDRHRVKVTFFMLGKNIERYPEIARAVYEQGHSIGNHSYDHPRLIFKSPSFVKEQIIKTDRLISSAGQQNTPFLRPPYSSKYIILPLVLRSLKKKLVTGTYDPPSEYISPYRAEDVAREVITHTKPGSIIYLHDGRDTDPEQFTKSVELIITGLRKNGYSFVTMEYCN